MRIVVALGSRALLRRGEAMTIENQRRNVQAACDALPLIVADNQLVISHGNGPQIGLRELEGAAYADAPGYPIDVLAAETQGSIGYLVQLELANRPPSEQPLATLLTMLAVHPSDPAFDDPRILSGPIYDQASAERPRQERGWTFRRDGEHYRRVVAPPRPQRIRGQRKIRWLLDHDSVVICADGGGVPTVADETGASVALRL